MLIIGLTGGSGVGKGLVSAIFEEASFFHIDTDLDARAVVKKGSDCLKELAENFEGILLKDGSLDRKALAGIVFSDSNKLNLLNKITHKYITERVKNKLEQLGNDKAIIDGAALFESGINQLCFKVIAVVSHKDLRIERIMKRDHLTLDDAKKRIDGQKEDDFYTSQADYVIINNEDEQTLKASVKKVIYDISLEFGQCKKSLN